ncbi:MAG TPA: PilZ domain-containing protein [Candidatus Omnitrophota bacterium]|nr:PilZ domain-containing protein [Candidatus Omnitrophota bacterium]
MEETPEFSSQEKRRHRRYKGVILEYAIVKYAKNKDVADFKPALIRDVSIGGVSIFVDEQIDSDEQLILRLYSSQSNAPIMAIGKVVWSKLDQNLPHHGKKHFNLGIEIVDIDKRNKTQLDRMIQLFDTLERKHSDDITTI